jgi:hypothetical protein
MNLYDKLLRGFGFVFGLHLIIIGVPMIFGGYELSPPINWTFPYVIVFIGFSMTWMFYHLEHIQKLRDED